MFNEYDYFELEKIKRKLSGIKIDEDVYDAEEDESTLNESKKKLKIYLSEFLKELNFVRVKAFFIFTIPDIKRAIKSYNYKMISLEELNDIEYNINLLIDSFTLKNIYLLNEFYNSSMNFFHDNKEKIDI